MKKNRQLRSVDFEDLLQECLLHWYSKKDKYDPEKGTKIQTFMAEILKRKLEDIRREQFADKRKLNHLSDSLDRQLKEQEETTLKDTVEDRKAKPEQNNHFLKTDLSGAIAGLSVHQQNICELILDDYPIKQISSILDTPRSTIYDEIKRIRKLFSDKGLEDYLK